MPRYLPFVVVDLMRVPARAMVAVQKLVKSASGRVLPPTNSPNWRASSLLTGVPLLLAGRRSVICSA